MSDVLGALFDEDDIPVMTASTFDYSITYTNQAFDSLLASPEFPAKVGDDVRTAVEWRRTFEQCGLGRALAGGGVQSGPVDHQLGWTLVASVLETGQEALVTCYFKWPDHEAAHHHQLVAWRVLASRAMEAAQGLQNYALDALGKAQHQMDLLGRVMVLSAKASQVRPLSAVRGASRTA